MVLLERERCLLDLAEWLDAAVEHGGLVALVEGEAGIGKTAVLQEFCAQQRRVGRVLWGACDALFTPRPLAPLHDIARQTKKALLAVIAAGNREAIFTAALDELECGPPALVVLEDMHWADDATLSLLKFLSRRGRRDRLGAANFRTAGDRGAPRDSVPPAQQPRHRALECRRQCGPRRSRTQPGPGAGRSTGFEKLHPRTPTWAHAPRGRGAAAVVRGSGEFRHRHAAVRIHQDRRPSCLGDPGEAGRAIADRGGRDGTQPA